jgi:hypothetical protein
LVDKSPGNGPNRGEFLIPGFVHPRALEDERSLQI